MANNRRMAQTGLLSVVQDSEGDSKAGTWVRSESEGPEAFQID